MKSLDTKIGQLSPEHRREVEDFVDFLLDRYGIFPAGNTDDSEVIHTQEDQGHDLHPIVLPPDPLEQKQKTGEGEMHEVIYVHTSETNGKRRNKKADDLLEWFE